MPNDTTPAPIGADAALVQALEKLLANFESQHALLLKLGAPDFVAMRDQARAALTTAAPAAQGDAEDAAHYRWLRDYFAAQALAGGLEQGRREDMDCGWWHDAGVIANRAYAIADAMLKAQRKK